MSATGVRELRTVADYQFGAGAGEALFPPEEELDIRRSTSGRPQQVLAGENRIVSYGVDGRCTLGVEGGRRLDEVLTPPRCRVVVGAESAPFVSDGKNAFSKFVRRVDPAIRPGDEVLVCLDTESDKADEDGKATAEPGALLAVGRAELGADAMRDFETGMAVKVREGVGTVG